MSAMNSKQFEAANKAGARWAVILGEREVAGGVVRVRNMTSGDECEVRREEIAAWLSIRKVELPS